jgi:hypothetical protein
MRLQRLPFLSLYYLIYFGIVATIIQLARDYLLKNLCTSIIIGLLVFLLPLIILLIAHMKPAFSKWLRVSLFIYFRVSTFAKASFAILIIFSVLFIYSYIVYGDSGRQTSLNLFLINLMLLFFIALLLSGRFQINDPVGLLIRQHGHHEVYLYRDRGLHHIPDPDTLQLLGYSFNDVSVISPQEFRQYSIRPPLESVRTARLVRASNRREVYIIIGGERRHVPDPGTLYVIQILRQQAGNTQPVEILPEGQVEQWPIGIPLGSSIGMYGSIAPQT